MALFLATLNRCLIKNTRMVFISNCKYVRCFSSSSGDIDMVKVNKYFDYLIKLYESSGKNDEILRHREVVTLLQNRQQLIEEMKSLDDLVKQDKDMEQMAAEEEHLYKDKLKKLQSKLLNLIKENIGADPCKDIIFEISAGVGGQESMLFTKDLLQMYQKHFDYLGYDHEIIELGESDIGGFRKVVLTVSGSKAYETLRHEAGVHRVQRVPATEKSGRIHTSVVSISVLPQPSEIEIVINKQDLKIETKRASGAGGQHVNVTDSAVRITHMPTGTVIECQTQRSQLANMKVAMLKLRMKLYQDKLEVSRDTSSSMRKKQMGLRNRNEKIRTYNYNQNRVTDHRLNENGSVSNLRGFLEGGELLENFQEQLQRDYQKSVLIEIINDASRR